MEFFFLRIKYLTILLLCCSCGTASGPLSLQDAIISDIPLPLYTPAPHSKYAHLESTYYYYDNDSELTLVTNYMDESSSASYVRVMELSIFNASGQFIQPNETTSETVPIELAGSGTGYICNVVYEVDRNEYKYTTCIWWLDSKNRPHKAYSILDKDKTVEFINLLQKVD